MIRWRRVLSVMRKEWWHITRDKTSFALLLLSPALALVTMDGEDIPALGEILNQLARIKDQSPAMGSDTFTALVGALEGYLEKVVLRETCDLALSQGRRAAPDEPQIIP